MANTKKKSVKKTSGRAKVPSKKSLSLKSLADIDAPMKSFKVSRDTLPFFGIRITRQTVYWAVLMAFIMIMQISILIAQLNILKATTNITSLL